MVHNEFLNGFLNNLRILHFAMFRLITSTKNIIFQQTTKRRDSRIFGPIPIIR